MTTDAAPPSVIPEILIVEDSRTQADHLKNILERNHFNVTVACNGLEALELLSRWRPTLVITDVNMPRMNGYELCENIRLDKNLYDIPVILLTSLSSPDDIFLGLECGADNFITKPFEESYLMSRIHYLLANSHLRLREKTQMAMEVFFGGRCHTITSDRLQILNLLLSTYETAVEKNRALEKTQVELQKLNDELENRVRERTSELTKEISQRERAEAALRETNQRLEQTLSELQRAHSKIIEQERLRALGTMASGIAHDFNNALSPVLGFSELLLTNREYLTDELKATRYIETIHTAAKDAASIVSRLREFYRQRQETDVFHPVDLNKLVEQAIELTKPKWKDQAQAEGKSISVVTDLHSIPHIAGIETELREALTNLIFNAVDAIPMEGRIMFRSRAIHSDVVLAVQDDGIGMSEEVRRLCLEPFFTTKEDRGTGLGLAMVAGIVRRHEGEIEVESTPGEGTLFVLRFSLDMVPCQVSATVLAASPPSSQNVLVVDDEELVREIVTEYLIRMGHTCEAACNGIEGIEKFRSSRFDLVITDRAMPEMSGDRMAAELKTVNSRVPVIMLTGFGELMKARNECPDGVDYLLSKPVTANTLENAIAVVLSRT